MGAIKNIAVDDNTIEEVHDCKAADWENIGVRVIDLYCIKPIDIKTLQQAAAATGIILTVEDHFPEGGLGEAVRGALWESGAKVVSLAVRKKPKSGKPEELLDFEEISRRAIVRHARELLDKL